MANLCSLCKSMFSEVEPHSLKATSLDNSFKGLRFNWPLEVLWDGLGLGCVMCLFQSEQLSKLRSMVEPPMWEGLTHTLITFRTASSEKVPWVVTADIERYRPMDDLKSSGSEANFFFEHGAVTISPSLISSTIPSNARLSAAAVDADIGGGEHTLSSGEGESISFRYESIDNRPDDWTRDVTSCDIPTSKATVATGRSYFFPVRGLAEEVPNMEASNSGEESMRLFRHWLRRCESNHSKCKMPLSGLEPRLPTRLIFVGKDVDARDARLVYGHDLPTGTNYTTLSHCWGGTVPLRLLKDNVSQFFASLPHNSLPIKFAQAMKTTRYSGISYLWIDSLCIIQDSQEDWTAEAAQMAQYYGNSHLTIAAMHAKDSDSPLFTTREPAHLQSPEIRIGSESDGEAAFCVDFEPFRRARQYFIRAHASERQPLHTRAWTMQELFLSRRLLLFGNEQTFWNCDCLIASEAWPRGFATDWLQEDRENSVPMTRDAKVLPRLRELLLDDTRNEDVADAWGQFVEYYCSLDITFPEKDKLVAISGLAQMFGDRSRYAAGLWMDDMPGNLFWRTISPASRSTAYQAPSWSWASVNGLVKYNKPTRKRTSSTQKIDEDGILEIIFSDKKNEREEGVRVIMETAEVKDVNLTFHGADRLGGVSSGTLHLNGLIRRAKIVNKMPIKNETRKKYSNAFRAWAEDIPLKIYSDVEEIAEGQEMYFFCLQATFEEHQRYRECAMRGLLLRMTELCVFVREGCYKLFGLVGFDGNLNYDYDKVWRFLSGSQRGVIAIA